jgi:hypothetical protein
MTEDEMKRLLKSRLEKEGFHAIKVRGSEKGTDVEAKFPRYELKLVMEVKGKPNPNPSYAQCRAQVTDAVFELLTRMTQPTGVVYAIVFPYEESYTKLVRTLPPHPVDTLGIRFLFIGEDGRTACRQAGTKHLTALEKLSDLMGL